ncbi:MAG: ACP S-malonyltransferase, partial [Gammaproteobacteria bacterium]|nr:ACP S-malonyltransferase [Gammaproteobacteria bacterium]
EGPEETLNLTHHTQPAMLAAGVAVWRVWRGQGGRLPAVMAGHSLGEYSALVCAGVLKFEQAVRLVAERGRLMQEAVPAGSGAMAAILGLEDAQVVDICRRAARDGEVVTAANFNSPGQVVLAGHAAAVERAVELARLAGAKRAVRLNVSVPSHCVLMKPAALRLVEYLRDVDFDRPRIPVIHNAGAMAYDDPDAIRDALARQLYSPVRWVDTIRTMATQGVTTLIECGPGKVLVGLNKRIVKDMNALAVYDSEGLQRALEREAEVLR